MIDVPGPHVWAAFSVKDHCVARPFVADVLLYDRLMIPTPPRVRPEDPESPWDPKEVEERWAKWDPQKLERLLRELCREDRDRATVVPWDERLRERWADKMKGYSAEELLVDANLAYRATEDVVMLHAIGAGSLTNDRNFRAVRGYPSASQRFARDITRDGLSNAPQLEELEPLQPRRQERAVRIGARFLVPDASGRPDEYVLEQALDLSSDPRFVSSRREFYAWLDGLPLGLSDDAVMYQADAAVSTWNASVRASGATKRTKFVFFTAKLAAAAGDLVGLMHGVPPVLFHGANVALEAGGYAVEAHETPAPAGFGASPGPLVGSAQARLRPVGAVRALTSAARYRQWQLGQRLGA